MFATCYFCHSYESVMAVEYEDYEVLVCQKCAYEKQQAQKEGWQEWLTKSNT